MQLIFSLYSKDLWPLAVRKSGILNISMSLVVLVETAHLFTNFDVKYAGAHPVVHLNTKTASRKYNCCLTGSQRKSFYKGVMGSNFPAPLTILQAKFCTAWSLSRLNCVVLLQTGEQQNSFLKTNMYPVNFDYTLYFYITLHYIIHYIIHYTFSIITSMTIENRAL